VEKSFLIETPAEINAGDLEGVGRVGVTAGASTPDWLIKQVVARLNEIGARQPQTMS
jgi:4-hydroxy-3-methylbut-2-enyl diphosphate reductase